MAEKLLLISHNPPPMADRAHAWAQARGLRVDARYPFLGDALPDTTAGYVGSIVYGGKFNADAEDAHPFLRDEYRWIAASLAADVPILGICLGAQMLARQLGGDVGPLPDGRIEFGFYEVRATPGAEAFLPAPMLVTQAHFHGFSLPPGCQHLAESDAFPNQAFRYGRHALGLQFHPEATAEQFRAWQEAYPSHYDRPYCQSRAEQAARIHAAQAAQAPWFTGVLDGLFLGHHAET